MELEPVNEEYESKKRRVVIFGRDLSEIPCARETLLTGFKGGLGMGLLTFLFTSNVNLTTRVSAISISVIGIGYWFRCRYRYATALFNSYKLKKLYEQHLLNEGVNLYDDDEDHKG